MVWTVVSMGGHISGGWGALVLEILSVSCKVGADSLEPWNPEQYTAHSTSESAHLYFKRRGFCNLIRLLNSKFNSTYEPSGPLGRRLSRFLWREATRSIFFYSPLDGMLVHRRVTPSIKFAGAHLYTWVERDTARIKCLAQENNTVFPTRTRNSPSGDERTNHEATAPSRLLCRCKYCSASLIQSGTSLIFCK